MKEMAVQDKAEDAAAYLKKGQKMGRAPRCCKRWAKEKATGLGEETMVSFDRVMTRWVMGRRALTVCVYGNGSVGTH